jgi:hypothetical protein
MLPPWLAALLPLIVLFVTLNAVAAVARTRVPTQGIDITDSNPCAEFQINILAAVAQFERELIIERVNAGIAASKQRGVKL